MPARSQPSSALGTGKTSPSEAVLRENENLKAVNRAQKRLVAAVRELSLARDLSTIQAIVRSAARGIAGADGATFVLREGDKCYYADEDAISPLWKGQRFPMSVCISGWVMLHGETAVVPDIYADPRVLHEAYRPTFVRSLAMVPIRAEAPIGAIGAYWSKSHASPPEEIGLLEALADTTAVAMENVQVYAELERRVKERTQQLEATNADLEAFSFTVSHDLRAPLRKIGGFTELLASELPDTITAEAKTFIRKVQNETHRMGQLIDDLLKLSRLSRVEMRREDVNVSMLAREIGAALQSSEPGRVVAFHVQDGMCAKGDPGLLRVVLENMIGNAWKYSSKTPQARIDIGRDPDGVFYVRDNGAGFDEQFADKLFTPFERLHRQEEFTGTGVGLATVQRIIQRHSGRVWAKSVVGKGATFYFTLPVEPSASATK